MRNLWGKLRSPMAAAWVDGRAFDSAFRIPHSTLQGWALG